MDSDTDLVLIHPEATAAVDVVQQQLQRTEKLDNSFTATTPEIFLLIEA